MNRRYHPVVLIGLSEYAKHVLSEFNNRMVLIEYDNFGKPLNIAPNGKQGIFCTTPDATWSGWFVLDDDVRFELENKTLSDIININEDHI